MEYEVQKGAESPVGNKISFLSGRQGQKSHFSHFQRALGNKLLYHADPGSPEGKMFYFLHFQRRSGGNHFFAFKVIIRFTVLCSQPFVFHPKYLPVGIIYSSSHIQFLGTARLDICQKNYATAVFEAKNWRNTFATKVRKWFEMG